MRPIVLLRFLLLSRCYDIYENNSPIKSMFVFQYDRYYTNIHATGAAALSTPLHRLTVVNFREG